MEAKIKPEITCYEEEPGLFTYRVTLVYILDGIMVKRKAFDKVFATREDAMIYAEARLEIALGV